MYCITSLTVRVTIDTSFTLRVTVDDVMAVGHGMVTRRVSEAAAEWWLISSVAVAQGYRFIERWGLRRACVWMMSRVLQCLPDGSGYL